LYGLLAHIIALCSLKVIHLFPEEHREILRRLEVGGVEKSGELEHKSGNISETRKDRGITMEGL